MSMTIDGVILKGIGGFYYVKTDEGVFECKAKGKFRKEKTIIYSVPFIPFPEILHINRAAAHTGEIN